jgi:hypothetical protein
MGTLDVMGSEVFMSKDRENNHAVSEPELFPLAIDEVQALLRAGFTLEGEPDSLDLLCDSLELLLFDLPLDVACATDWVGIDMPFGGQVLATPEGDRVRLECLAELWLEAPTLAHEEAEHLADHLLTMRLDPLLVPLGFIRSPEHVMIDDEGDRICAAGNWQRFVDGPVEAADLIAKLAMMELQVCVEADELDEGEVW